MSAAAFEIPTAPGLSLQQGATESDKRLYLFVGASMGQDSNYNLEPPNTDKSKSVTEGIAGVALLGGNYHRKYEFRYQGRADSYPGEDVIVRESKAVAGVATHSQKLQLGLRAKYAWLSDPVEIDTFPGDSVGREEFTYTPDISFGTGRTEFGLKYAATSTRYDDFARLDHDDTGLGAEFRWWRSEVTQWFLHYDAGSVEYVNSYKSDFDYTRTYAGLRTEAPSRMGFELGVGMQALDSFSRDPGLSESRPYAAVRLALTPGMGTSKLEFGCVVVDEPSATSDYKSVTMFELRYRRNVNRRLNWSVRLRSEDADLVYPRPNSPTALQRVGAAALVNINVGSIEKLHGRIYMSAAYDVRDGDSSKYLYERFRATAGFAFVY